MNAELLEKAEIYIGFSLKENDFQIREREEDGEWVLKVGELPEVFLLNHLTLEDINVSFQEWSEQTFAGMNLNDKINLFVDMYDTELGSEVFEDVLETAYTESATYYAPRGGRYDLVRSDNEGNYSFTGIGELWGKEINANVKAMVSDSRGGFDIFTSVEMADHAGHIVAGKAAPDFELPADVVITLENNALDLAYHKYCEKAVIEYLYSRDRAGMSGGYNDLDDRFGNNIIGNNSYKVDEYVQNVVDEFARVLNNKEYTGISNQYDPIKILEQAIEFVNRITPEYYQYEDLLKAARNSLDTFQNGVGMNVGNLPSEIEKWSMINEDNLIAVCDRFNLECGLDGHNANGVTLTEQLKGCASINEMFDFIMNNGIEAKAPWSSMPCVIAYHGNDGVQVDICYQSELDSKIKDISGDVVVYGVRNSCRYIGAASDYETRNYIAPLIDITADELEHIDNLSIYHRTYEWDVPAEMLVGNGIEALVSRSGNYRLTEDICADLRIEELYHFRDLYKYIQAHGFPDDKVSIQFDANYRTSKEPEIKADIEITMWGKSYQVQDVPLLKEESSAVLKAIEQAYQKEQDIKKTSAHKNEQKNGKEKKNKQQERD